MVYGYRETAEDLGYQGKRVQTRLPKARQGHPTGINKKMTGAFYPLRTRLSTHSFRSNGRFGYANQKVTNVAHSPNTISHRDSIGPRSTRLRCFVLGEVFYRGWHLCFTFLHTTYRYNVYCLYCSCKMFVLQLPVLDSSSVLLYGHAHDTTAGV